MLSGMLLFTILIAFNLCTTSIGVTTGSSLFSVLKLKLFSMCWKGRRGSRKALLVSFANCNLSVDVILLFGLIASD